MCHPYIGSATALSDLESNMNYLLCGYVFSLLPRCGSYGDLHFLVPQNTFLLYLAKFVVVKLNYLLII